MEHLSTLTSDLTIAHQRKSDGQTQSLEAHLIGVGKASSTFAAKIGLREAGELMGLVHDLGKYSTEFQTYIKSAVGIINPDEDEYVESSELKGKIDHSTAGAQLVWKKLSLHGQIGEIAGQIIALCVASHHSGLIDCLTSDPNRPIEDTFTKRINKPEEKSHFQQSVRKMDSEISSRFDTLISDGSIVGGIADTIRRIYIRSAIPGVNARQNKVIHFKISLLVRFLFSSLIDADRTDSADFEKPFAATFRPNGQYTDWSALIALLEQHLGKFSTEYPVDEIRKSISESCLISSKRDKGIFTLSVPTGGGKTLASLRFALNHAERHKLDRVIYVIPFTSIIDQNADVVRGILEPAPIERGSVVLEHHSNLTPEKQTWQEKLLTENWDAPVVFTTSVQFLESLFSGGTRSARRMHQLANSVLIFDEIQTLPINCIHIFCNAINFLVEHCGSSIVLCTATQPLLNKVDPRKGSLSLTKDSELMPDVRSLFRKLDRVAVLDQRKVGGWSNEDICNLAYDEVSESGSCLVIVNTKQSAQFIYDLCRSLCGATVFHLSTNMCPAHRKVKLHSIRESLKNNSPIICVSTQLIEAGVDVDFGSVIRFVAGLDSIAQAAGRCNRNGIRGKGRVHVVNPSHENTDMLKDILCGKQVTERILDDVIANPGFFEGGLIGEEAMAQYFEYYFFNRKDEMSYHIPVEEIGRQDTMLNLLSINSMALGEYARSNGDAKPTYLKQSFMAAGRAFKAIDAPTQGVVVPYGTAGRELVAKLCAAFEPEKRVELLKAAQQYTVNIFPNVLKELQQVGAIKPIGKDMRVLCLLESYYSFDFGLSLEPVGDMESLYFENK
jgi:CRISPR-associated endonuclease/helicase Cas3